MSNLKRSILLTILTSAGLAYSSPSAAQPTPVKAPVPARASMNGKFVRYLESPNRDVNGIILEDGTVVRFEPFKRTPHSASLQPGDSVHVEGDVVSGLPGPYLIHALVRTSNLLAARGDIPPPSKMGSATGASRSPGAVRHRKSNSKEHPPSQRKRLETVESKVREATTGKPKSGNYSQWSRDQETAGP